MVTNAKVSSSSDFRNVILAFLSVSSTVAAAVFQQVWLAIVPFVCILQLKQNPSLQLQLLQKQYGALVGEMSSMNTGIEELSQKLTPTKAPLTAGQKGRISLIIDGDNTFLSAKEQGLRIDYQKLIPELSQGASQLIGAFHFASVDSAKEKEVNFLKFLNSIGYKVVSQEIIQHKDGSKEGNLDPEIMLQMIRCIDTSDTVVLVSGDGDFKPFVEYLKEKHCRVEVYGFEASTNKTLKKVSDRYVDLKTLDVFKNNPDRDNPPKPKPVLCSPSR
ncbi:protein of unknown function DUF88 (plasmid) [Crinalium epipsammum PCC 9333]|uniref:NYN domain-containing protein n=1 Tax=Crinalium epipsammum PCC 9333 TaxID=1173022 RepID=K9W7B3_9CYAN|nr:NYN domain-containing protein [Crinalium epipsammum]AFZ15689.1 protein of unknown function DUF88 [Crinalium epipsammum PCC 9333]